MTAQVLDLVDPVPHAQGLAELAAAVRESRPPVRPAGAPTDALASLFEVELRLGLEAGDATRAYEAAVALWRRTGQVGRCYDAVRRALDAVGAAWCRDACTVAAEHRVTAAAAATTSRLRAHTRPPQGPSPVLLTTPPGDRHVLALDALAHQLEEGGQPVDVLGDLPLGELLRAAASARAVVLSVHTAGAPLGELVTALRRVAPHALLVVGGPGARSGGGADLHTSDVDVLLAALVGAGCPLSPRELEVLQQVAEGQTNAEAAAALGISPATLKTHLDRVFDKTGTTRRGAAVALALRSGWI